MKIAILGWGSLVWNPGLPLVESFAPVGPKLKIEFSRVSNGGRLTLVLDEKNGAYVLTYVAQFDGDSLDDAIYKLSRREGTPRIGFIDLKHQTNDNFSQGLHRDAFSRIKAWAEGSDFDAVIWTGLKSNFHEPDKAGMPFSPPNAMKYIASLKGPELERAVEYIAKAPPEVVTDFRVLFAQELSAANPFNAASTTQPLNGSNGIAEQ